ncbi:S1/P1 nuclease [Maribacter sp. ACAM166]|uniref:S1/P1 nuclease n=1 Tax=Maribacter sp. ACAM166 TaxID=2508996 RepID=UPI002938E5F5|nr:S1/P1 nuclease [Maribacter sp. ACAM166]
MSKFLMMKSILILVVLVANFTFANDMVWSKTGHRVVGEVAEQYLSKKAKRAISNLLDGKSLAAVANFGDEIKADRAYSKFSAWHYVNIPFDKTYADVEPNEYGDLVQGINSCIDIIKDETSSREDKVFYLKFLVHLIGDLHQPMHVGREEDKGGNDIQLQWFGKGTNLHRVWDSNMITDNGMSFTELAFEYPEMSKQQVRYLQDGTLLDWVEESHQLAESVYESVATGEKLGYRYSYDWWDTVADQLQKGGIRLASVLNDVFK